MSHISTEDLEPRYRTIVRLPTFERSAQGLLTEQEQAHLELWLALHPRTGDAARELVFLILVYAKNEQESLSADETRRMRHLIRELEAER